MKKRVLIVAVLAMALLLLAAVAWDSVRYVANARHRVELADAEMRKHEQRLVGLLSGSKQISPQVQAAIDAYKAADGIQARHEAYEQLIARFRQTMSNEVDPTNPLDRAFMDDIAGAINRREVSQKRYDVESAAYQEALGGLRGGVARMMSPTARADWQSGS